MTITEIKELLKEIELNKDDNERAHYLEDDLYLDLLTSIADQTCDDPILCAKEAIKAADIDFNRWYA